MAELTEERVRQIIPEVMQLEREKRIRQSLARQEDKPKMVTKLYLITFSPEAAFPDPQFRSVLHKGAFAYVDVEVDNPQFYAGQAKVVAFADGRLLDEPIPVIIAPGGWRMMAEASPTIIDKAKQASA